MRNVFTSLISFVLPIFMGAQPINQPVLEEIKSKALVSHSDAVIIMQGDTTLYENFYSNKEKPIYIASAGKSLVSLAIGKLLYNQQIDSLDQPVYNFFPEWNQGTKKQVTIRMLLNHTSGIQNYANASLELEPPPRYQVENVIQLALAAELSDQPGSHVAYNNKAVALLGGIIEKASGLKMDEFFKQAFFKPMDIKEFDWIKDKSGNPTAHGAFVLKPSDLLKFGLLLNAKGLYNGQRLVSEDWIKESLSQGQTFTPIWGLLWWRLPAYEKRIIDDFTIESWKNGDVEPAFISTLLPLKNQLFQNKPAFFKALEVNLGNNWAAEMSAHIPESLAWSKKIFSDKIIAYYATGNRGNYLVVVPEHNIVAVRCADADGFNYETDYFQDFVRLVANLGTN